MVEKGYMIVGFKNEEVYHNFDFPMPIPLTTKLEDVIDFNIKKEDKYYYLKGKCPFYDKLEEGTDKILHLFINGEEYM